MSTADPASPARPVAAPGRYQVLVAALVRDRVHGRARRATTVVRYLVATMFLLSVVPKLTAHQNEIRQFGRFGLPESSALVYTVAALETLGAVLLILGLLTRLAAAGLVANMIGAILTAGVHVGGPVHLGLGPALLLASAYIAWAGPGALALDHRWPRHQHGAVTGIAAPSPSARNRE